MRPACAARAAVNCAVLLRDALNVVVWCVATITTCCCAPTCCRCCCRPQQQELSSDDIVSMFEGNSNLFWAER